MSSTENNSSLFPKGEDGGQIYFTGQAWVRYLVPNDELFNALVLNVEFEAGARNYWHKHPGGQILIAINGTGYYQEKGKAIQLLKVGDVVKIAPNVEHWHGASPNGAFTHIAINPNTENGIVQWLSSVSDEEYNNIQ